MATNRIVINAQTSRAEHNRLVAVAHDDARRRKRWLKLIRVAMLIVITATVITAAAFVVVLATGVVK